MYRIQGTDTFVTASQRKAHATQRLHVDINLVDNDKLDLEGFRAWRPEYAKAELILEDDGYYLCGHEVEKMSKSKYNVQTPDDLVERYGADTLRCYEMFLGPLTQHKPWDTQGISGVHNFLRKTQRLYTQASAEGNIPAEASDEALHRPQGHCKSHGRPRPPRVQHRGQRPHDCRQRTLLGPRAPGAERPPALAALLSPYAPHLAEELWASAGGDGSVLDAAWPLALTSLGGRLGDLPRVVQRQGSLQSGARGVHATT